VARFNDGTIKFKEEVFMKKLSMLVISAYLAGGTGLALAQAATPGLSAKEEAHPRIYEVKDRIKKQQKRIDQGLKAKTLTDDQAKACREVLKSVKTQMKADYKTNGSKKLNEDQTAELNKLLDANSAALHEEKQEAAQATAVPVMATMGVSK
jgi:hypothetical protein